MGLLLCAAGCGTRRETARTFLCRVDAGSLIPGSLVVSADRRHLMYAEGDNQRQRVVVDGKAGPWFAGVLARTLALSRDGKRHAYGAGKGKLRFIVLDGAAQKPCDGIREGTPVFSPDGGRAAWGELRETFWSMVVDGREGWKFDELWPPVFSPDGKHVAYVTRTGPKMAVVLDSVMQAPHDDVIINSLEFTGPSAQLSYIITINKRDLVRIRNGRIAMADKAPPIPRYRVTTRWAGDVAIGIAVVHDNTYGPVYNQIGGMAYSPDSGRFAYVARKSTDWFSVIDGKQGKAHPFIFGNSLVFTADGRHTLFATKTGNKRFVVLDDRPGQGYDLIFAEGDQPLMLDSERSFHYLALKGDSVFVVEEKIK